MDNGGVREKELHIVNKPHYFGSEFHVKVMIRLGHDSGAGQPLNHLLDRLHGGGLFSFVDDGIDVVPLVTALADDAVGPVGTGGETSVIEANIHRRLSCASEHDDACYQNGHIQQP